MLAQTWDNHQLYMRVFVRSLCVCVCFCAYVCLCVRKPVYVQNLPRIFNTECVSRHQPDSRWGEVMSMGGDEAVLTYSDANEKGLC